MAENKGNLTLSVRDQEVLYALVESYLNTGEPVSSRVLAQGRPDGLSPATIRNIMAKLEEHGYLYQPHTSAGRLPTRDALRLYVSRIREPKPLEPADEQQLQLAIAGVTDEQALRESACRFLSQVSHQVGVVAVVPWTDTGLRWLRFMRLADRRVLAILVTTDMQVRERVSRVPEDYTQDELDSASRYFNQNFAGWNLERIRKELIRHVNEDRAAYDALLKRALVLYHCGLLEMKDSGQVYLEGTAHLVSLMRSHEQLRDILQALGEKEKLLKLLTSLADEDGDSEGRIRISVGLENAQLPDVSLVAASYRSADHTQGAIGILGSTRMEYDRAIRAVGRVRDLFSRVLKEN